MGVFEGIIHVRKKPQYTTESKVRLVQGALNATKVRNLKFTAMDEADPKFCQACLVRLSINKRKNKFCSRSCAVSANNGKASKRKPGPYSKRPCSICGLMTKNKKCCSNDCWVKFSYQENVRLWLSGSSIGGSWHGVAPYVRRYLIENRGNRCELCGWCEVNQFTGRTPIQVHHLDDPMNHEVSNLQLLCPSCHSLTPNFGGNGKGRPKRYDASKAEMGPAPFL